MIVKSILWTDKASKINTIQKNGKILNKEDCSNMDDVSKNSFIQLKTKIVLQKHMIQHSMKTDIHL